MTHDVPPLRRRRCKPVSMKISRTNPRYFPAANGILRQHLLLLLIIVSCTLFDGASPFLCVPNPRNAARSGQPQKWRQITTRFGTKQQSQSQQQQQQQQQRLQQQQLPMTPNVATDGEIHADFERASMDENESQSQSHSSEQPIPILGDDELRAIGWQPHFAEQLSHSHGDDDEDDDDDDDDDDVDSGNTPLVPLRITEVRSKTIHAVGAAAPTGTTGEVREWFIPVTPGQKIVNANDEKVVVAGDWILVEPPPPPQQQEGSSSYSSPPSAGAENEPPRIRTVLNRRSVLKRRAPGRNTRRAQLIAANLDTVFVVSSCNQDFNVARLERYIAMVLETENVEPVIVLTKKDLLEDDDDDDDDGENDDDDTEESEQSGDDTDTNVDDNFDDDLDKGDLDDEDDEFDEDDFDSSWLLDYYQEEATSIAGGSVPVVCLDARNPEEANALLAPWLGPGQTVAFVGSSGVGKSTLANTLCAKQVAATGDIHTDSGQGRHTTTRRQLHFLKGNGCDSGIGGNGNAGGAAILDTPGLRELQLVDAAQGLDLVFSDLVELSKTCRFNDCKHEGEPGCAVAAAVEHGDVDGDRVARWFKLVAEDRLNSSEVAEGKRERERKKNLKRKKKQQQRQQQQRGGTQKQRSEWDNPEESEPKK